MGWKEKASETRIVFPRERPLSWFQSLTELVIAVWWCGGQYHKLKENQGFKHGMGCFVDIGSLFKDGHLAQN